MNSAFSGGTPRDRAYLECGLHGTDDLRGCMRKELLGGPVKEDLRLDYEKPYCEETVHLPVLRVDLSVHEGSDISRFYDLTISDVATIARSP
ncbi:unnamed protein product [Peronospora farinosa]|uniref:Uncharacterized protein n=1 Tax=Peronospora farinosa TaxID=134698 RepID=A0ABN8C7Q4_9STRA|nr:unnamed protein product [Peronospora farinosa]